MTKENVKLTMRYIVVGFIMYLAYIVTSAEWLKSVDKLEPMNINVIVGAVFGALTLVIREHMNTTVSND